MAHEIRENVARMIAERGPIPCVRVSSAKARGSAKAYRYWGAARYEIRLGRDGAPICVAQERASSDRRSYRLAKEDAEAIAIAEQRYRIQTIGRIDDADAEGLLRWLRGVTTRLP